MTPRHDVSLGELQYLELLIGQGNTGKILVRYKERGSSTGNCACIDVRELGGLGEEVAGYWARTKKFIIKL